MMEISHKIGFIGLGVMGFPMAVNMLKKSSGVKLFAFDISNESLERLKALNPARVECCLNASDVASKADVIFTMMPEGSHVRSVFLTPETDALTSDLSNKLILECSTIDPATSSEVRSKLLEHYPSTTFYDAPVSEGSVGAENATLTFMVGCHKDDSNFPRIEELLSTMGSAIIPCGAPSTGLTAKLCNNYCSGLIALVTAEAFNIAIRSGMDPRVLKEVFASSTAQSCISDKWNPVPGVVPTAQASNNYKPGFKVQLMAKDLGLAVEAARQVNASTVLGQPRRDLYKAAGEDENLRDLGSRIVFRYIGGIENWQEKMVRR